MKEPPDKKWQFDFAPDTKVPEAVIAIVLIVSLIAIITLMVQ